MSGLLDSYQESTDTALRVMAARPPEPDTLKPKHSAWSTIPRAIAAGVSEVGGNLIDFAGAYGQVQASTGANRMPFVAEPEEDRKQRVEGYDKLKTDGIDWRTDESKPVYSFARDLRPDPLTAGTAENIFFGLTKGLTKAIGGLVTLGPAGGATVFGTSEGMTVAEDLAVQGVDKTTRTKVGAVTGVINAASVALPVAGQTFGQTAALVLAGGPASFVAQQLATRTILENADYGELAQQYDPLDLVGLTVSTLIPYGFAAVAMRSAIRGSKPVTKPDAALTQDQLDAVMAHNLTASRDSHEAVTPSQIAEKMGATRTASDAESTIKPGVIDDTKAAEQGAQTEPQTVAKDPHIASIVGRVEELSVQQPDMPVALLEDGTHSKVADELDAIRRQVQEGTDTQLGAMDAPLLKVAADCFLSIGTSL